MNEDSWRAAPELGLYIVCDGMGGHSSGDVASALAAETVVETVRAQASMVVEQPDAAQSEAICALLRHAVEAANSAVYDKSVEAGSRGMGTTCSVLMLRGSRGMMAHVGDSRLYLARSGQLHQVSQDHTYVAEAVRHGIMTREEAMNSGYGNIVTRAVGPQASVLVDTLAFDVLPGDTYLLCSDGLHGYFQDPIELLRLIRGEVEGTSEKLVDLANERGGDDNITAVVIRADAPDAAPAHITDRMYEVTQDYQALRQMALLCDMSLPQLARLGEALKSRAYNPGDEILAQGSEDGVLFIIAEGTVAVKKDGKVVAELRTGQHFGEMSLLNNAPANASVVAQRPTRCLVLEREPFFTLLQHDTSIGAKFLWRMAQALSQRLENAMPFLAGREDVKRTMRMGGHVSSPFMGHDR